MNKIKTRFVAAKGFTLIELLVVIAIIGILASVVLVSTQSGVNKAKRASALSTASSALTELITCADDGGEATNGTPVATTMAVCCETNACAAARAGHTATWPDISGTGWAYGLSSNSLATGDYQYTLTKAGETTITCRVADGSCT